jgi:hypothetical protein
MKPIVTALAATLCGVALLVAAVLTGVAPLPFLDDGDRPPCSQLPSEREVRQSLESHRAFVDAIEGAGPGVSVTSDTPCGEDDRALVTITVSTDEERSRVETLLRDGDGFGVPAQIEG